MTADRVHVSALVVIVALAGCLGGVVPVESVGDEAETATPADGTATTPATPATQPTATTATTTTGPNGTLEVHFVNVGQSVATLLIGPTGETMLIDTGHFTDDGEYVVDYLQRLGVERLDSLVVSHADADHIGGNAAVIEYFETEGDGVGAIYDPGVPASTQTYEEYLDAVERYDVQLYQTRAGDSIPFDGVETAVLGPPEALRAGGDRNENSLILRVAVGATSFLFTGDAEDDQEAALVERYDRKLNVTVLKTGHHGSESSTGDALLDAATPKTVVVSSAFDSQYGHPSEATLDRLAQRSIPTYWTATHGTVVLTSDGRAVEIATQSAAPTEPARLRVGDPVELGSDAPAVRRAVVTADGAVRTATDGGTTTTTATADATATAAATTADSLDIVQIHADAAGSEFENLNDEYVVFETTGDQPLDIGGWTVSDEAGHSYTIPPGTTLAPGDRITLHTGSGSDTATDLYWDRDSPVWNNAGDTVIVRTDDGTLVEEESYS